MVQTVINWLATALQTVIAPFLWVWQLIKLWIRGRLAPRSAWAMELCVVAATVVGLGWLNWQLGLERYLAGPRTLRSVWLGLVALLCYTSVRFLMFLARTLRGRQTDFDDIRRGFHAGCDAAIDARINLQDSPLFLVLGADA